MESTVIFLIIVFLIVFIAFPAWVIVRVSEISRELRETRGKLDALQGQMRGQREKTPAPPAAPAQVSVAAVAPAATQPETFSASSAPPAMPASPAPPPLPPPVVAPALLAPPPVTSPNVEAAGADCVAQAASPCACAVESSAASASAWAGRPCDSNRTGESPVPPEPPEPHGLAAHATQAHGQDARATQSAWAGRPCDSNRTGESPVPPEPPEPHGLAAHATQAHGQDARATQSAWASRPCDSNRTGESPVPPEPPEPHGLAAHATQTHGLAARATAARATDAHATAGQGAAVNWEVFMGTKFLSWLGAVAAFFAVVYLLKFSIDHGLIPPVVRAAMGFVFSAGLVVGGMVAARKKYEITGHALCAAGIVSLYGVTFACRALYHFPFFGVVPTFAMMALITTAAFTLAAGLEGKFIAILGLAGGFATPVLLSTGVDNPLGLFGYIALLNTGLCAVALHRRWDFLVPLGALGTALTQTGWALKFLNNDKTLTAMIVCLAFNALFLAGYCVARRLRREGVMHARSVAALVAVSFGFALHLATGTTAGKEPWFLLGFVFLADACVLAVAALDRRATDSGWMPAVAGGAVFVVLGAWILAEVAPRPGLLPWALAGIFVFAALHTAFPLLLARARPDARRTPAVFAMAQFFAPMALMLVIIPVLDDSHVSWLVWPAILLIDFAAIACAAVTRLVAGLVASLVLTLTTAAVWVCQIPVSMTHMPVSVLLVVGGFAVLFFAASLWLGRRRGGAAGEREDVAGKREDVAGESGESGEAGEAGKAGTAGSAKSSDGFNLALPALSSLLPFVLIVMMETRLALADPTPVFGLGLLLAVLALGLAKILKNEWLPACALAGVLAICWVWFQGAGKAAVLLHASNPAWQTAPGPSFAFAFAGLGWAASFFAIFAVFPFVFRKDFLDTRGPWITAAASGILFFPLVYSMIKTWWPNDVMGLVPAVFAAPALASLVAVLRFGPPEHPRRLGRLALFGGAALLFITLVFPIQLSRQWITIAWALEGAALLWLYTRVPHRALPWAGAFLLAVAFARLALNPAVLSYHARGATPVFNWYLYTHGIAIACMFGGAWFLRIAKQQNKFTALAGKILPALGAVLAFLLLNIEIADFFTEPGSLALALEFSGNFARDMTYTIAWALFALALLVAGIWRRLRAARYAALALLAVVAGKLFLHDLASLDTLYRVGAFFGVALVMILASFLYQKYIQ